MHWRFAKTAPSTGWGLNSSGEIGNDSTTLRSSPVTIHVLGGVRIAQVSAGFGFSLAVDTDGQVWAWGNNGQGRLGDGTATERHSPIKLAGISNVAAVAAGSDHSLALTRDGQVWAWGDNSRGQLGDGTTTIRTTPGHVAALTGTFVKIATGNEHSLALRSDGTVWAWGNNFNKQLGDGTTTDRHLPVQVQGLPAGIQGIDAGTGSSAATDGTQAIWAWGTARNPLWGTADVQLCGAFAGQFALAPHQPRHRRRTRHTTTADRRRPQRRRHDPASREAAIAAVGLHVSTVVNVIDNDHVGTVSATDPAVGTVLETDSGAACSSRWGPRRPSPYPTSPV